MKSTFIVLAVAAWSLAAVAAGGWGKGSARPSEVPHERWARAAAGDGDAFSVASNIAILPPPAPFIGDIP